ncbi:hypothetical protein VPMS16_2131 [Vibrio sp. 16]|nr:hypothetical protein VPMS16_2131 [Vibrio sp. 16]
MESTELLTVEPVTDAESMVSVAERAEKLTILNMTIDSCARNIFDLSIID